VLSTAIAVRFDHALSSGKTRPCLLACTIANGNEIEVVAKFAEGCELKERGLIAEAITAVLAADLDLPVPEPFLVPLSDEFIREISDSQLRRLAESGSKVCFGSKKLPPGFSTYPADKPLPRTLIPTAAEIFAFDHFIANPDRTVANPNLLFNGRQFAIYDHELAFFTEGVIGWRAPWEDGGAQFPSGMPPQNRHVFLEELRGKLDLDRLSGAFDVVTNERLTEYRQALPDAWVGDGTGVDQILAYIQELKDKLPLAINQLLKGPQ
jgi:hypothetical protein